MVFFFIPLIILAAGAFGMAIIITTMLGTEGWMFAIAVAGIVSAVGMVGWVIKNWVVRAYMALFIMVFLGTILSPFGVWLRELVGG